MSEASLAERKSRAKSVQAALNEIQISMYSNLSMPITIACAENCLARKSSSDSFDILSLLLVEIELMCTMKSFGGPMLHGKLGFTEEMFGT